MRPLPTLRQLRYLCRRRRASTFRRAAEDCLVTQSTLSAGIRELKTYSTTLIGRSNRNVALTAVGEEIVARAQTRYARQTNWSTRRMSAAGRSRPAPAWRDPHRWALSAAQVLPQLRHSYPDLRLYLREEQTARVLEMLGRGRVDGGIIALPYLTGDLETMLLGEDPLLVACPKSHAFATAAASAAPS